MLLLGCLRGWDRELGETKHLAKNKCNRKCHVVLGYITVLHITFHQMMIYIYIYMYIIYVIM